MIPDKNNPFGTARRHEGQRGSFSGRAVSVGHAGLG
jgi:hypothetical protein